MKVGGIAPRCVVFDLSSFSFICIWRTIVERIFGWLRDGSVQGVTLCGTGQRALFDL